MLPGITVLLGIASFLFFFLLITLLFAASSCRISKSHLAQCDGWCGGYGLALHHRQDADRLVHWCSTMATSYGSGTGALRLALLWVDYFFA